ncbi:GDSL esterase/lipase At1g71691 [Gastrolobium bilobum]|uniref:GDSL esterase/lipase At1g71691 n=1 Tax=Gastrolobium bilobum TaxID=150636 RepID=UPI002AB12745|nr:GDSL esterase/lipase At1g71691 [Gastrolobium bilobum]
MAKFGLYPFLVLFMVLCAVVTAQNATGREVVPAMFIFGDSLIDNGNNNDLPSFAKANYFPYGIDFNGGPTGRFSNGFTMVDEIAKLLGLPLIPAYSEASGDQVLHGVNYASAAAGILDATGGNFVGRIPFNEQIRNFESTLNQITSNLGADYMATALARCIFFVGMGSNDYLNNYLMPNYPTRDQYNQQQYADLLAQAYNRQLTRLYNLGARKFVITGLGLMGCIPSICAQSLTGNCSEEVNLLVQPFNANVRTMLNNFNTNLPGSRFIFIDTARMFRNILLNARSYGFTVVNRGCCGIGRNGGQITCLPFQTPCPDRNQYVFWDAYHPTEAVNVLLGRTAFNGNPDFIYPINIKQLAEL